MIVFSESSPQLKPSASARDLHKMTETARLEGFRVFSIPQDFEECESAVNALWHVPHFSSLERAIWIGYIPAPEHYEAFYNAAFAKNIKLPNTPAEFCRAEQFHQYYPFIQHLTPKSYVVSSIKACEEIAEKLQYPVFVKGTIQSLKQQGLQRCLAKNFGSGSN